jgi:hypothetical protein
MAIRRRVETWALLALAGAGATGWYHSAAAQRATSVAPDRAPVSGALAPGATTRAADNTRALAVAPNNPFNFAPMTEADVKTEPPKIRQEIINFLRQPVAEGFVPSQDPKMALERILNDGHPIAKSRLRGLISTPLGALRDVTYPNIAEYLFGPDDQLRMTSVKSPFTTWVGPTGRTGPFRRGGVIVASWYALAPQDQKLVAALKVKAKFAKEIRAIQPKLPRQPLLEKLKASTKGTTP